MSSGHASITVRSLFGEQLPIWVHETYTFRELRLAAATHWSLPPSTVYLQDGENRVWPDDEFVLTGLSRRKSNRQRMIVLKIHLPETTHTRSKNKDAGFISRTQLEISDSHNNAALNKRGSNPNAVSDVATSAEWEDVQEFQNLEPKDKDRILWTMFAAYSIHGSVSKPCELSRLQWIKFLRDCKLCPKPIPVPHAEVMYSWQRKQVNDGKRNWIGFGQFMHLVHETAVRVYKSFSSSKEYFGLNRVGQLVQDYVLPNARRIGAGVVGLRWVTVMTIFKKEAVISRHVLFRRPLSKLFNYYTICASKMHYDAFHTFLVDFELGSQCMNLQYAAELFLLVASQGSRSARPYKDLHEWLHIDLDQFMSLLVHISVARRVENQFLIAEDNLGCIIDSLSKLYRHMNHVLRDANVAELAENHRTHHGDPKMLLGAALSFHRKYNVFTKRFEPRSPPAPSKRVALNMEEEQRTSQVSWRTTPKLVANSLLESRQSLASGAVGELLGKPRNGSRPPTQHDDDDNARFYLKKEKVLNLQDSGAKMLVRVDALLQHSQKLNTAKSAQSTLSLALSISTSEDLNSPALSEAQVEFWKVLKRNSEFLMGKAFVVEADILLQRLLNADNFGQWYSAVDRSSVEPWHKQFSSAAHAYYSALELFDQALLHSPNWTGCLQSSALAANSLARLHSLARCFFGKIQLPTQHNKEVRKLLRYAKHHMERACHDAKGQNLVDPTSKSVQTTVLASIFILCSFLDCITIPPGNSVWRLPRLQPAAVPIADTMFGTFDAERNKRWTVHNAQEFNYYCGEPPLSPETFKWLVTSFGGQQMQPQHKNSFTLGAFYRYLAWHGLRDPVACANLVNKFSHVALVQSFIEQSEGEYFFSIHNTSEDVAPQSKRSGARPLKPPVSLLAATGRAKPFMFLVSIGAGPVAQPPQSRQKSRNDTFDDRVFRPSPRSCYVSADIPMDLWNRHMYAQILLHACPYGLQYHTNRPQTPEVYYYNFAFGDTVLHAAALLFYEEVSASELGNPGDPYFGGISSSSKIWAPIVLTVGGFLPLYKEFADVLLQLLKISRAPAPFPFEHYVHLLMEDVPRPLKADVEDVLFFLGNKPFLLDMESVESERPSLPFSFDILCRCLSDESILATLACVMSEQRIVFHSEHSMKLAPCMLALLDLAHPFKWTSKLSFLLPEYLLDQLHSPTSFFVGVLNHRLQTQRRLKGIVYVDLDRDHIHSGRNLPHFPRVGFNELAQNLRRCRSALQAPLHPVDIYEDKEGSGHEHSIAHQRTVENIQKEYITGVLEASDKVSQVHGNQNQSKVIQQLRKQRPDQSAIEEFSDSMTDFFALALANVPAYVTKSNPGTPGLITIRDVHKDHALAFDDRRFLKDHPDFLFPECFRTATFRDIAFELAVAARRPATQKFKSPRPTTLLHERFVSRCLTNMTAGKDTAANYSPSKDAAEFNNSKRTYIVPTAAALEPKVLSESRFQYLAFPEFPNNRRTDDVGSSDQGSSIQGALATSGSDHGPLDAEQRAKRAFCEEIVHEVLVLTFIEVRVRDMDRTRWTIKTLRTAIQSLRETMALANSSFSQAKLESSLQMHDKLLLHENHLLHERNAEESDSFYWDSLSAANKRRILDRYSDREAEEARKLEKDMAADSEVLNQQGVRRVYRQVKVDPDEDGLVGLVLDLTTLDKSTFVVIKSFARPDSGTILPAEQCGKLFVGDILLTLNGKPVTSYHGVIQRIIRLSGLRNSLEMGVIDSDAADKLLRMEDASVVGNSDGGGDATQLFKVGESGESLPLEYAQRISRLLRDRNVPFEGYLKLRRKNAPPPPQQNSDSVDAEDDDEQYWEMRYFILDYETRTLLSSSHLEDQATPMLTISTQYARVTKAEGTVGSSGALSFYVGQPDVLLTFLCSDSEHRDTWVEAFTNLIEGAEKDRTNAEATGGQTSNNANESEPTELLFTFEDAQLGLKLVNESDYCRVSGFSSPEAAAKLMGVEEGDFVVEVNGVRTCPYEFSSVILMIQQSERPLRITFGRNVTHEIMDNELKDFQDKAAWMDEALQFCSEYSEAELEKFYDNGWTLDALKSYYKGIFNIKDFDDIGDAPQTAKTAYPFLEQSVNNDGQTNDNNVQSGGVDNAKGNLQLRSDEGKGNLEKTSDSGRVLYKLSTLLSEADDDLFDEEASQGSSVAIEPRAKLRNKSLVHSGWADVHSSASAGSLGSGRKWVELFEADDSQSNRSAVIICRESPSASDEDAFEIILDNLSLVNKRGTVEFDVYTKKGISNFTVKSDSQCDNWLQKVSSCIDKIANRSSGADRTATAPTTQSQFPRLRPPVIGTSLLSDADETFDGGFSQSTLTESVCEGWLFKSPVAKPGAGKRKGRWLRRWFTLVGRTLEYRTSEDADVAKGTLILADGARCREIDNEKLIFELSSVAGTVSLQAETIFDKQMWFNALRSICSIETISDQTFKSLRDARGLSAGDMSPAVPRRSGGQEAFMGTVAAFKKWQQTRHAFFDLLKGERVEAANVSHALALVKDDNVLSLTREYSSSELEALVAEARAKQRDSSSDAALSDDHAQPANSSKPAKAGDLQRKESRRRFVSTSPTGSPLRMKKSSPSHRGQGVTDLSDPADAAEWVDKCQRIFVDWDKASMLPYREAGWTLQGLVDYRKSQDPTWQPPLKSHAATPPIRRTLTGKVEHQTMSVEEQVAAVRRRHSAAQLRQPGQQTALNDERQQPRARRMSRESDSDYSRAPSPPPKRGGASSGVKEDPRKTHLREMGMGEQASADAPKSANHSSRLRRLSRESDSDYSHAPTPPARSNNSSRGPKTKPQPALPYTPEWYKQQADMFKTRYAKSGQKSKKQAPRGHRLLSSLNRLNSELLEESLDDSDNEDFDQSQFDEYRRLRQGQGGHQENAVQQSQGLDTETGERLPVPPPRAKKAASRDDGNRRWSTDSDGSVAPAPPPRRRGPPR